MHERYQMRKESNPFDMDMWQVYHNFYFHCDKHRFQKMFARYDLFRMVMDMPGDIVDAGVYKGTSTILWAHLLETYQPHSRSKIVAFDTFEKAFDHARADESDAVELHQTSYDAGAYDNLVAALDRLGLSHRVELIKGDIVAEFPRYLAENPGFRINLLHCDLDVYLPTAKLLTLAWPRLVNGGIAVFDEYAVGRWGESDAVDEVFATLSRPPRLKLLSASPTPTAYCVKGEDPDDG